MRRIQGSDTLPERLLSQALTDLKVEHVRNDKTLPGTPDISIPKLRAAVFVHGCFWHGCPVHYKEPKTRLAFWRQKLQRTKARDRRVRIKLLSVGWKVATIWEHEVQKSPRAAASRLLERFENPSRGSGRHQSLLSHLKGL